MMRVLVAGAGNGGFAAAADLARRGATVMLYNRTLEALWPVMDQGGVRYTGVFGDGLAPVARASGDLAEVMDGVDLILVCTTASAHEDLAALMVPHLSPGQCVVLNPGGMLGSVAFSRALRRAGYTGALTIGETGTLTYICRKPDPGSIRITSAAAAVPFAAFPSRATAELVSAISAVLPGLDPQPHVLAAGFANINAILHPPAMVFGAAWIEHTAGDFYFYYDAATPAVGRLLAALDRERMAIAAAWGLCVPSFLELFGRIGSTTAAGAASGDHRRALLESAPNRYIKAPPSLDHRYLHEDVPFGVVPLADLGHRTGVPTPFLDAVVTLSNLLGQRNYWAEGRTLDALGFTGLVPREIVRLLTEGPA
jgi:opine dehydrogenase